MGDTGGTMAYTSGANNTFIDLSKNGAIATAGDGFANATTTLDVNYMATGAAGAAVQKTATISVGTGTNFADTAQGMIQAIDSAGLGLTASFATATQAGTQAVAAAGAGHGTDTGIVINGPGAGVGKGTTPGSVGVLALGGAGEDSQSDVLSGTLSLKNAAGANITVTLGQAGTTDTMANLANTLTSDGFTVASNLTATTGTLTITTQNSNQSAITGASLGDSTAGTGALTYTAGTYYTTGVSNSGAGTAAPDIADAATGQTAGASATFTADTNSAGGTATISYSDNAGQSLSATDLSNQTDAQAGTDCAQLGHHRRGGAGRLHRRADQHAERGQPGADHAVRKREVGAERGAGHRLCVGDLQHVEVRDSEPDRHRGAGAGQQRAAGSDQAVAVNLTSVSADHLPGRGVHEGAPPCVSG